MQPPHFRRTLVSLAPLGTGFTAQAADETMTVVGKRSQHQEVATTTRTNTPAKLVPQTIDSVKVSELTAFGQPTLSEALSGIRGLSARAQLTDEIYLRGGIAIQDAQQVKADADLQGKRPMNVSRQNGQFYLGYKSGEQGWFGETGVTAVGDRFADNANSTTLPGYARFDARAGYHWQQPVYVDQAARHTRSHHRTDAHWHPRHPAVCPAGVARNHATA